MSTSSLTTTPANHGVATSSSPRTSTETSRQFILPDWFVATYRVRATGLTSGGFAETTFTDGSIGLSATQGETASPPGTPTGTYVNGNVTTYREGDRINFRFIATNSGTASDGSIEIEYSKNAGCDPFFLSPFTLGTYNGSHPVTEVLTGTPGLTVSLLGSPVVSASDWNQRVRFQFTGAGSAQVYFYLQLSSVAAGCSGSSAHYGFDNSSEQGDMANTSTNAVSVPAGDIIALGNVTVIKRIDRNGDGDTADVGELATTGEYEFCMDKATVNERCLLTDASGQVVFTDVSDVVGGHPIVEEQKVFTAGDLRLLVGVRLGNERRLVHLCGIFTATAIRAQQHGNSGIPRRAPSSTRSRREP